MQLLDTSQHVEEWGLQKGIAITYLVTTSLSILGSLSIVIFVLLRGKVTREQVLPVFHIAAADCIASCSLFGNTVAYLLVTRSQVSASPNLNVSQNTFNDTIKSCRLASGAVLCCYSITFLLTLAYALYWYLTIRSKLKVGVVNTSENTPLTGYNDKVRYRLSRIIYFTAWLLPVLVAIVVAAVYELVVLPRDRDRGVGELYRSQIWCIDGCLSLFNNGFQKCHTTKEPDTWFAVYRLLFHGVLLLVLITNVILYYLIVRMSKLSIQQEGMLNGFQRERLKNTRWRVYGYQIVFLICWTPSLILAVSTTVEWATESSLYLGKKKDLITPVYYFVLYYLQAVTAPLQGFLNAIVYGWKREVFRRLLTLNSCCNKR
ncbi:transmembrane protein 116-like [Corticium candelabrum]|uniref:transmembrane protein 116-like n=1 Tax=Corticium candelabrum TaxID=121492 RepID=UPI002E25D2B9|nr:transmembrane protein 116-like [Corticium candelabrum]